MCWNESVSWATFIIGTIFNILVAYLIPNPYIIALAIAWEAVVIIQLFEALGWRNKGKDNNVAKIASYGVYVTTLLQPIIILLALLIVTEAPSVNKTFAVILMILYLAWVVYVSNITPVGYLSTSETCSHIEFNWWSSFPLKAIPYLVLILIGTLLLVKPLNFAIFLVLLLSFTYIISASFYSCSIGSMWCWFSACLMPIIGIYFYYNVMNK